MTQLFFKNYTAASTNCRKWPSTIRLRYPVPVAIAAGTGAGT